MHVDARIALRARPLQRRILPLQLLSQLPTDDVTRGHGLTLTPRVAPPCLLRVPDACPAGRPRATSRLPP
eukprot:6786765-Prymnesium_polylepis.1